MLATTARQGIYTFAEDQPTSQRKKETHVRTRLSTLAPELDKRETLHQNSPRTDTMSTAVTRGNVPHSGSVDDPALLHVDNALRDMGSISRDFEHAIVDDDHSTYNEMPGSAARRGSVSPMVPRRSQHKRGRHTQDPPQRSRESSSSSVSTSPPNSVEAFAAGRRRDRANTIGSKAPSDLELGLHRTVSGGTHRRRPTFSNASVIGRVQPDKADDTSDEDVGFPTFEDSGKTYKIDFEELEEFVVLSKQGQAPCARPSARRHSHSAQPPKVFHDLRKTKHNLDVPHIITHSASPHRKISEIGHSDDEGEKNEKLNALSEKVESIDTAVEPNRFTFLSSDTESTIHAPQLGDLLGDGDSFRDMFDIGAEGGVWWLDVEDPTEEELNALSRAFRVHPLTNEDIRTQESREKVELFPHYYFVCFRTFHQMNKNSDNYLEPLNVYMVVYREGVLTFSYSPHPHAANTRKRMSKLQDFAELGPDWICYAMM